MPDLNAPLQHPSRPPTLPAIPVPDGSPENTRQVLLAMKEILEVMLGRRSTAGATLPPEMTDARANRLRRQK